MKELPKDYAIPTTNAEGLALLWQVTYPAEIAGEVGVSRAAAAKWKSVPIHHLQKISAVTGIDRRHLAPETANMLEGS